MADVNVQELDMLMVPPTLKSNAGDKQDNGSVLGMVLSEAALSK